MTNGRRGVVFQKRNSRKGGIFLKKDLTTVVPLTTSCQICNIYHALNGCSLCKRLICIHHTFSCKKTKYCLKCYNSEDTHNIIMSIYLDEMRITIWGSMFQRFLDFISFEWTRKKIEPYNY